MKKIITIFMIISLSYFLINCDNSDSNKKSTVTIEKLPTTLNNNSLLDKYSYVALPGLPKSDWIGKSIKIKFDDTGSKLIAGRTKIIQLLNYGTDSDGYKYFSIKDLDSSADMFFSEIYYYWFGNAGGKNGFGPNIMSWEEAIQKKDMDQ